MGQIGGARSLARGNSAQAAGRGADDGPVSTAAAPSLRAPRDPASDELVRSARGRDARRGLDRIRRRTYAIAATVVGAGIAAAATTIHAGPAFDGRSAIVLVATYTLLTRIRFEAGTGFFAPLELALVPMLFALPLGLVPAAVALALVAAATPRIVERRDPARILPQLVNAGHSLGPVAILAIGHGLPLRWSAWPVYAAALLAQFAADAAISVSCGLGHSIRPRVMLNGAVAAAAVDSTLAPIGLCVAFATRDRPELIVLVLPLALLLRHFGQERKQRIDHALELSDAYRGTAFLLGDVVEADDAYTGDHSRHVVDLVLAVADDIRLDPADRRVAEFVALLHDVGKIKIPGEIIGKPGPLTAEERAVIETHTIVGEQLLEQVGGLLAHVGRVVRSCHEHWDGGGYPDGLAGEDIPLVARIVCACDAFSAMTTDRPYRAARSEADALVEMRRCSGTQFDPQVVDALCRVAG
jgi:putative nucleotidyltransferase with HDIG domain